MSLRAIRTYATRIATPATVMATSQRQKRALSRSSAMASLTVDTGARADGDGLGGSGLALRDRGARAAPLQRAHPRVDSDRGQHGERRLGARSVSVAAQREGHREEHDRGRDEQR